MFIHICSDYGRSNSAHCFHTIKSIIQSLGLVSVRLSLPFSISSLKSSNAKTRPNNIWPHKQTKRCGCRGMTSITRALINGLHKERKGRLLRKVSGKPRCHQRITPRHNSSFHANNCHERKYIATKYQVSIWHPTTKTTIESSAAPFPHLSTLCFSSQNDYLLPRNGFSCDSFHWLRLLYNLSLVLLRGHAPSLA